MLNNKTKALEEINALIEKHSGSDDEYDAGTVKGLELAREAVEKAFAE